MAKDAKDKDAAPEDLAARQAEKDAAEVTAWLASPVGRYVNERLSELMGRTGGHPPSVTAIGRMPS